MVHEKYIYHMLVSAIYIVEFISAEIYSHGENGKFYDQDTLGISLAQSEDTAFSAFSAVDKKAQNLR